MARDPLAGILSWDPMCDPENSKAYLRARGLDPLLTSDILMNLDITAIKAYIYSGGANHFLKENMLDRYTTWGPSSYGEPISSQPLSGWPEYAHRDLQSRSAVLGQTLNPHGSRTSPLVWVHPQGDPLRQRVSPKEN
jgi:hypothetical protein